MLESLGFFLRFTEIIAFGLTTIVGSIVAYGLAAAFVTLTVIYLLVMLIGGLIVIGQSWARELGLVRPSA